MNNQIISSAHATESEKSITVAKEWFSKDSENVVGVGHYENGSVVVYERDSSSTKTWSVDSSDDAWYTLCHAIKYGENYDVNLPDESLADVDLWVKQCREVLGV